jgi:hypothetical protein
MQQRLTNKMLSLLLSELGFEPGHRIESNQKTWRHPASGCTIVLPTNKINDPPRPADLVGIKGQLDLHGHLDEDLFDGFVIEGKLPVRGNERL